MLLKKGAHPKFPFLLSLDPLFGRDCNLSSSLEQLCASEAGVLVMQNLGPQYGNKPEKPLDLITQNVLFAAFQSFSEGFSEGDMRRVGSEFGA